MNKMILIKTAFSLLSIVAFIAVSIPFIQSMNPTDATVLSRQTIIDVSKIKVGEVVKHDSLYGEVWVTKRSKQEINDLPKDYFEPLYYAEMDQNLSADINQQSRSKIPEIFVFTLYKWNDKVLLEETPYASYSCDKFDRVQGNIKVNKKNTLNGGFACQFLFDPEISYENNGFVYDLAGRPVSPWVSPLRIPKHFYNYAGKLIVGPKLKT